MEERQKRLLQDMMKFTKNSDGLAAVSVSAPITTGTSNSGKISGSNHGSVKEKNQSASNQTPKKSTNSSDVHFSGSAFLSSPDPSALPMPNFGEDNEVSIEETKTINNTSSKSSKITKKTKETNEKKIQIKQQKQQQQEEPLVQEKENKTNILKKFLKLRKA